MQQTFSVTENSRIRIARLRGDLEVRGWDKREISLEWEDDSGSLNQEGNTLTLLDNSGDVAIFAPYDVELQAENLNGEVEVEVAVRMPGQRVESGIGGSR